MKKIALLPALALALMVGTAQAQKQKEKAKAETKAEARKAESKSDASVRVNVNDGGDGTHVRVEKTKDGQTEILERTFSDQASADRFLDSVNTDTGNKMRISVRTDRNRDRSTYFYNDGGTLRVAPGVPTPPKAPRAPRAYRDDPEFRAEMREFERDMEKFGRDMERWGREYGAKMKDWGQRFERDFKYNWEPQADAMRRITEKQLDASRRAFENMRANKIEGLTFFDGSGTTSSRTVKALNAYPNQPANGRLNVTFQTPEKGDVLITVTDVKGKEVARETVKDFSGKYVGQVDLKRNADKGTYFVTVTQGEDGAVKRIVVE